MSELNICSKKINSKRSLLRDIKTLQKKKKAENKNMAANDVRISQKVNN